MITSIPTLIIIKIIASVIIIINHSNLINSWTPDIEPKFAFTNQAEKVTNFFGNSTDFFKILDQDDSTILIGAKNAVYNLSVSGLRENYKQRIEWSSTDADRELCALKGKQEQDCQNYIRVFARINDKKIMICGTNSYKPRCRYYNIKTNNNLITTQSSKETDNEKNNINSTIDKLNQYQQQKKQQNHKLPFDIISEVEAQGRCPYNPQHNSTYIYTDGQLYSATVADFSGADPLIYRETLRTEQYDLKQLNQPAFISALELNGYVFFFFREIAMEYMNCGKKIYSRVGRVCKNDRGGPYAFNDRWTSFLKTRLNCSVPGEYPFYFDEIQATSKIIDGIYRNGNKSSIIYAVFTTSINAIPGSAVCAFSINDILYAFEGRFKYQKDTQSNWLPLSLDNLPNGPRPGQCVDDSRTLSSTSANFIKTHTLMEQSVTPLFNKPLLTRVRLQYRLTAITIDPQILALDGNTYDIIFVGTDSGEIVKFINVQNNNNNNQQQDAEDYDQQNDIKTIVIAEIQALPKGMAVRELTISHKTLSLIVLGDGHIVSIPLHHCSQIIYCLSCLQVQDPYCVWDISNQECKAITNGGNIQLTPSLPSAKNYIQSLNSTEQSIILCEKYGDIGNRINNHQHNHHNHEQNNHNYNKQQNDKEQQRPSVYQSTRGTVSGIAKSQQNIINNNNNGGDNINNGGEIGIYPNHRITLTSIDPADIDNSLNNPLKNLDDLGIESETLKLAGRDVYCGYVVFLLAVIVFIIGVIIGWYSSKRLCKNLPFHPEHRNQLTPKSRQFNQRNSGKDINLLMNTTNPFSATASTCNNKKDNLEHEFVVGAGEKDRSHECKNSTENLEKETHKTGTLTKVKRTYI